ncbi:MAG: hypothetical protein INR73_26460 [Williamsia sp.]|nr:hypothetical protein [Williamsia sp.]
MVRRNGTNLNEKTWGNRAKRKMITQKTILSMIDVAKEKGAKDREKAYLNTCHCQNRVVTSGGMMYGQYCKNRFQESKRKRFSGSDQ